MEMVSFFTWLGQTSISSFWLPIGFWTLTAIPLFLLSKCIANRFPQIHYHGSIALLLSLPLGFLMVPFLAGEMIALTTTADIPTFLETTIIEAPQGVAPALQPIPSPIIPDVTNPAKSKVNGYTLSGVLTLLVLLFGLYHLGALVHRWVGLRQLRRCLRPVITQTALLKLAELRDQLSIKPGIMLMHGPASMTPLTFGWRKPVIMIPEEITNEPHALETALLHELVHVKQRDYIVGLFARVIKAIFTFHPFVLLLEREARIYRELSCDSEILELSAILPANYARLLVRFNTPPGNHYSVSMISNKSILKQRIEALVHHNLRYKNMPNRARLFVLPLLLLMPAVFMACNVEQLAEYPTNPDITILEEIGMSLKIPEVWLTEEPTIFTTASYADSLPFSPPPNRYVYKEPEGMFAPFKSTKLDRGERFFYYTDVTNESVMEVENGERTFFYFFLHIEAFGNKNNEAQSLWKKGKCKFYDGKTRLCKEDVDSFKLIKVLEHTDIPFDADSGFLYKDNYYHYENPTGIIGPMRFFYHFYAVKNGMSYRIQLNGASTDPEKAQFLKSGTFLKQAPFAEMLSSIQFHNLN